MKKLQVSVSDEVAERVKEYSSFLGMSVSAFCSIAIGEKIMQYKKAYEVFDKFASDAFDALKEEIKEEKRKEVKKESE